MLYHFKRNYFSISFTMAFGIAVKLDLKIKPQLNEKLRLSDNFHTSEFPYEFFSSDLSNDKV